MTDRDQIIAWAREAGIFTTDLHCATTTIDMMQRFASLVAAHEREQCARVCNSQCKEADGSVDYQDACHDCAAAIRGRAEK